MVVNYGEISCFSPTATVPFSEFRPFSGEPGPSPAILGAPGILDGKEF